jgi:type II secretory ATPase GspE/PulE/Tfp pilus assembly ATPase PilB-like protein
MLYEKLIKKVNCDLINCLLDSEIIGLKFANELKKLGEEETNFRLVKILANFDDSEKTLNAVGMEILESDILSRNMNAISFVGEKFSVNNTIIPVEISNDHLIIVTADPFDTGLMDSLRHRFSCRITFKLTYFRRILDFWGKTSRTRLVTSGPNDANFTDVAARSVEPISLEGFFENLLEEAVRERASDIHLENFRDEMRLRIRVDGRLHVVKTVNKVLAKAVVAKIKIRSRAKVDEIRLPQDRRVRVKICEKNYDLRVSILPTIHGENIAIRIFDQGDNDFCLDSIGLFPEQRQLLNAMIGTKNGLILLCGPTGCGKTTTLYTILKKISSPEKKVVTIEDPIEYRLDGINQVPVNDEIGLSFASILRSVLRQSPNVIMVGEIRDWETAELAIQAALTGHLVFSTVHCSDSVGSIRRLLDFKISEHLIKSCLRGAISQKLLRRPCKSCMSLRKASTGETALLRKFRKEEMAAKIPELHGCEKCSQRGYSGRIAAFDFLISEELIADIPTFTAKKCVIFDDFVHAETFVDSATRLLEGHEVVFEDVCTTLL